MVIQHNNWLNRSQIDCYGEIEDVATRAEWGGKKISPKKLHLNTHMKHLFEPCRNFFNFVKHDFQLTVWGFLLLSSLQFLDHLYELLLNL